MQTAKLHLNWAPYRPYDSHNVQKYAPVEPGVYKLSYPNNEGSLTVFYVGQADNLDSRLKSHLLSTEPNQCIRQHIDRGDCRFTFAVVPNKHDRDGAERALYDYFTPRCNNIAPPGSAIEINPKNG